MRKLPLAVLLSCFSFVHHAAELVARLVGHVWPEKVSASAMPAVVPPDPDKWEQTEPPPTQVTAAAAPTPSARVGGTPYEHLQRVVAVAGAGYER